MGLVVRLLGWIVESAMFLESALEPLGPGSDPLQAVEAGELGELLGSIAASARPQPCR